MAEAGTHPLAQLSSHVRICSASPARLDAGVLLWKELFFPEKSFQAEGMVTC